MELVGLPALWTETLGDQRICIAILDGPVDRSHPSFAKASLSELQTLVPSTAERGAALLHGTHIASVIFGQHDGPVKGIAPCCRGLIVPVFRDGDDGSIEACSQLDLARAISQAAQEGAHIINISGGESSPSGIAHPLLADAVRDCAASGVLVVAAVGNEGCECLHIPGALPSVLAVGAMNTEGRPLDFSNWGDRYQAQAILAPGESILGASPGGGTVAHSGTSYATPVVSGVTALLLSLQIKLGQNPDPRVVRAAILASAIGCDEQPAPECRRVLAGRLNVKGAMARIRDGEEVMPQHGEKADVHVSQAKERPGFGRHVAERLPAGVQGADYESGNAEDSSGARPDAGSIASPKNEAEEPVAESHIDQINPQDIAESGGNIAKYGNHKKRWPNSATGSEGSISPSGITAAACECGAGTGTPPQLVFALGQLGYDFGTEARRDSITQHMDQPANPYDAGQFLAYLDDNPWDAAAIFWTLNLDTTPIYVIQGQGAFAGEIYERLRVFMSEQVRGEVERVSIPGYVTGSARLFTGHVVPVIWPVLRGMYSWNTTALAEAAAPSLEEAQGVTNFLRRVYEDLRNLGISPQERAINYAATNAFQANEIFKDALAEEIDLDTIAVERSPICRPESECWDVRLTFFNPRKVFEQARKVYRFTVDVSDTVPVTVGQVRSWFVR